MRVRGARLSIALFVLLSGLSVLARAEPLVQFAPVEVIAAPAGGAPASEVLVIRGGLARKGYSLIVGNQPARLAKDGSFVVRFNRGESPSLRWLAVDPWGGIESGALPLPAPIPPVVSLPPAVPSAPLPSVDVAARAPASVEPASQSEAEGPAAGESEPRRSGPAHWTFGLGNQIPTGTKVRAENLDGSTETVASSLLVPTLSAEYSTEFSLGGILWRSQGLVRVSLFDQFNNTRSGVTLGYLDGETLLLGSLLEKPRFKLQGGGGLFGSYSLHLGGPTLTYGTAVTPLLAVRGEFLFPEDRQLSVVGVGGPFDPTLKEFGVRITWTGPKLFGWATPWSAKRWGLALGFHVFSESQSASLPSGANYILRFQRSEFTLQAVASW